MCYTKRIVKLKVRTPGASPCEILRVFLLLRPHLQEWEEWTKEGGGGSE